MPIRMKRLLLLLLLLLLPLTLGSGTAFVGCGSGDVNGYAAFGCSTDTTEDPCDYIVTLLATILLYPSGSPIEGARVYIDTGPPDSVNTKLSDINGEAFWEDTAFLTGYSARCGGRDRGTVEPYDADAALTYDLFVSAAGYSPNATRLTVSRSSRDMVLTVMLSPL